MKSTVYLIAGLCLVPFAARADTSWICAVHSASTFQYTASGYIVAPRKSGATYLLRPIVAADGLSDYPEYTYIFELMDETEELSDYYNKRGAVFDADIELGDVYFTSVKGDFDVSFSPDTLKFTVVSVHQYIWQQDIEESYPFIEIGGCASV